MANLLGALQATGAFTITPSDTQNVSADPGNPNPSQIRAIIIHNPSAGGAVRVLPAENSTPVTIYIPQGSESKIWVQRVYATSPIPPSGLVAYYGGTR